MISGVFWVFFASVSDASFKYFICLQMYVTSVVLNVSKIDWVLHLPPRLLLPRLCVSSTSRRRLGIRCLLPLFSMPVTFWTAQASHERVKWREKITVDMDVWNPVHLDVGALANLFLFQ
jgi:hypothetical protein